MRRCEFTELPGQSPRTPAHIDTFMLVSQRAFAGTRQLMRMLRLRTSNRQHVSVHEHALSASERTLAHVSR